MAINFNITVKKTVGRIISALGALGVAMQNTIAVALFLRSTLGSFTTLTKLLSNVIHGVAIGFGGISSGMVNFYMNVDLLDSFIERMSRNQNDLKLKGWRKFRYYAGTFVFVITGILFGATAFTFGMTSPFAALAVAAGVLVSIIMTIQEVETWLDSFKLESPDDEGLEEKTSLYYMFLNWKKTLTLGKAFGHFIAAGNVIALSLLFTLGLAEVLIGLQVAAFTAFVIASTISFTFGAFTEFYFYNFFLADFCNHWSEEWQKMKNSPNAVFGFACIAINAFVNGALTYSGVGLLSGLLVTAGFALPPVGLIIGLSVVSAIFSGSASFLLGMKFWIPKPIQATIPSVQPTFAPGPTLFNASNDEVPYATPGLHFFTKANMVSKPTGKKSTFDKFTDVITPTSSPAASSQALSQAYVS